MIKWIKSMLKSSEDKELSKIKAMAIEAFAIYNANFPETGLKLKEVLCFDEWVLVNFIFADNIPGDIQLLKGRVSTTSMLNSLFSGIHVAMNNYEEHADFVKGLTQKPNPKKTKEG